MDGSVDQNYEVHGIIRRSSSFNTGRVEHIYQDPHLPHTQLFLHHGDLTDSTNLFSIISKVKPDEVYNLGAQSHVKVSFELSEYTAEVRRARALRSAAAAGGGLSLSCEGGGGAGTAGLEE
jgi:GDPmannose 4,6-dehydratase